MLLIMYCSSSQPVVISVTVVLFLFSTEGYPNMPDNQSNPCPEPFQSVEDAWFWTMAALAARNAGAVRPKRSSATVMRPCEPDDVVRCLDRLYRKRRIDLGHAKVMRVWGERGRTPSAAAKGEQADHRIWREAMERLDWPLREKGIVQDLGNKS